MNTKNIKTEERNGTLNTKENVYIDIKINVKIIYFSYIEGSEIM